MQYFLQLLISGLAIGAIYGLIAMGFAVIYKSTGLVNFAQGEMTMITAYIAWTISTTVISPLSRTSTMSPVRSQPAESSVAMVALSSRK